MSIDKILKQYDQWINPTLPELWYKFSLPSLNRLVGGKGLRGGRIVQFIGAKSTGKTTLALDIIANAQKDGHTCAFVDFERTYDPEYARYLGVDTDKLILIKTDTAEQGLTVAEELIQAGVKVIVVDSIPAAMPKSELEKDLTEAEKMAVAAGFITRWGKRIIWKLDNNGALCIVINQWRANFSTMSRKETKPAGPLALQYNVSLTLELARIKNGEDETIVQAFVEKNKQGGKERDKVEVTMMYGEGFDTVGDIIRMAIDAELVQARGAWYYYGDLKCQGLENAKREFPIAEIQEKLHGN